MNSDQPIRLPDTDMRKPRRSAVMRVLGWLVGLGVLSALLAAVAGSWLYASYTAPGPLAEPVIVNVPKIMLSIYSIDILSLVDSIHMIFFI